MTPDTQTPPVGNGKKILIIEDEKPLSHALQLKLNHEGFETVVAMDGEEGLLRATTDTFDMILMDIIMPKMDGFNMLTKLKEQGIETNKKVIVLSNLGQDEDMERAKEIGILDYMVKSNTPISKIVEKVKIAIGQ